MKISEQSREINVDARILLAKLKSVNEGDVVNYSELSELIGLDVQNSARHILASARRWARRERIIFEAVTGKGLKRLDDIGKVKAGSGMMDRIRRSSRRAAQTLASVEKFGDLPNEMKIQHNMAMSVFGIVKHATSTKTQDKISERVEAVEGGMLAMKKSLELFA